MLWFTKNGRRIILLILGVTFAYGVYPGTYRSIMKWWVDRENRRIMLIPQNCMNELHLLPGMTLSQKEVNEYLWCVNKK